ncbi:hypothetical protein LNP04_04895 [Chryseobacterium sp. C-71]|uniref:hypothetical protein n=1 Tax=Chryseobacterium sp. C-71 TaxID=2893882 RepID=UPI001E306943|nr:hypothetical protein [Chryseobacterium sp. C-71]UFH33060.1 hypothetical protein LNP04_04895 [Chryseobacterium sp. C-71]
MRFLPMYVAGMDFKTTLEITEAIVKKVSNADFVFVGHQHIPFILIAENYNLE